MGDVITTPRQVDLEADLAPRAMMLRTSDIAAASDNLRRSAASPAADLQLRESVAAMGIRQPLLVRPGANGEGWTVVDGHRRLRIATELAIAVVPAWISPANDMEQLAVQAASNVVRVPLEPVDQWRAVVALQERGYSLPDAAHTLGLPERRVRQLDKLGRLHPKILAEIEAGGMPPDRQLHAVAACPMKQQEALLKLPKVWDTGKPRRLVWHQLAEACSTGRISRTLAIFDVAQAGVAFEEDLFAEPGSDDQFTTADTKRFLAAQAAALTAEAKTARKPPVTVTEPADWHSPKLPKGWQSVWTKKAPKGAVLFKALITEGPRMGQVVEQLATPPAPKKPAKAPAAGEAAEDADDTPAPAPAGRGPITQRGRELLAAMQTQAIRTALLTRPEERDAEEMLELLLLALCANNVAVTGAGGSKWRQASFDDIAAQLLDPDGRERELEAGTIQRLAAEALARILIVSSPTTTGSGDAAHWIARAIDAKGTMPRLDTEEFLATLSADAMRACAQDLDMPTRGTAATLRASLVGKARALWIQEAEFTAPGPEEMPLESEDE